MTNPDTIPAGPELDRLIATKVMGWELWNYETEQPAEAHYGSDGFSWRLPNGKYGFEFEAWKWQPSTNIAHAWEVAEKMRASGLELCIYDAAKPTRHWVVCTALRTMVEPTTRRGEGETTPTAICRAALKACGD